eukprot:scaffold34328_cov30-Attheya_sp.AAC.1
MVDLAWVHHSLTLSLTPIQDSPLRVSSLLVHSTRLTLSEAVSKWSQPATEEEAKVEAKRY